MTSAMPAVSSAQGKLLTKDAVVGLLVGAADVGGGVGRGVGGVGFCSHFPLLQDLQKIRKAVSSAKAKYSMT